MVSKVQPSEEKLSFKLNLVYELASLQHDPAAAAAAPFLAALAPWQLGMAEQVDISLTPRVESARFQRLESRVLSSCSVSNCTQPASLQLVGLSTALGTVVELPVILALLVNGGGGGASSTLA